jgi:hypothetical protein
VHATARYKGDQAAYRLKVRDPDDGTTEGTTERLEAGPSRPPLLAPVPATWRRRAAAPAALVLGVALGVGTVLWWQAQPTPPTPPRFRGDEHAVELILFEAVPSETMPRGAGSRTSLRFDGALLLSGQITSTVFSIELLGQSFDVRAPRLPLTVSPSDRFRSISLRVSVRDCERAIRWEQPGNRPFVIMWRDEFDRTHTDRAGDFGSSTGNALIRHIHAVCDGPRRGVR